MPVLFGLTFGNSRLYTETAPYRPDSYRGGTGLFPIPSINLCWNIHFTAQEPGLFAQPVIDKDLYAGELFA